MGQAAVNLVAPASAGTAGRSMPAVRGAFTLIELLVVIGIFLLLMGLTIGSVVSTPKLNRMLAAEQVVADCIRQARHTARTSGQPVVLRLRKAERSVGGLLRQTLWSDLEDWPQAKNSSGALFDVPGRTGTGLLVPECLHASDAPLFADLAPATFILTGGNRLWRGQSAPTQRPGLLLSLSVRPPTAGGSNVPDVLPLALVGEDLSSAYASIESSLLGLALVRSDSSNAMKTMTSVASSWELVGWFGQQTGRVEVSSITDAPADQNTGFEAGLTIVRQAGSPAADLVGDAEANPLVGGRWTEITLLVDGPRLVLYRDGRRVGEKAGTGGVTLPTFTNERMYIGYATLGGSPLVSAAQQGPQLDDVRLERLGDTLAGTLPAGVAPQADQRIVCHPDGRVEVDATGSVATATTTISMRSDSGERATITVTTAGSVTSRLERD